jgi:hypothetical protein
MKKIIFVNQTKPYLAFHAAALLMQLDGSIQIEPTSAKRLSGIELELREEAYILDISPLTAEERRNWTAFQEKNEGKIKFWAHPETETNQNCWLEMAKSGFQTPESWKKTSTAVAKNDPAVYDAEANRIIRAYKAYLTLDFNTDSHHKHDFVAKLINEIIAGETDREISALANFQRKSEEALVIALYHWNSIDLKSSSLKGYPFKATALLTLNDGKEIDNFLDVKQLIDFFKQKIKRFVVEYYCRGRIHYIYIKNDEMFRKSYAENLGQATTRIRAAERLLHVS